MGMIYPKPKPKPKPENIGHGFGCLHGAPPSWPADAVTGCSVRPENFGEANYGYYHTKVGRDGNRHWWFEDSEDVAKFRKEFKSRLVKVDSTVKTG